LVSMDAYLSTLLGWEIRIKNMLFFLWLDSVTR